MVPLNGAGKRRRWVRRLAGVLALPVVGYIALQLLPQLAFAHHVTSRNFTLYSNAPIDSNVAEVVRQADVLLSHSPIYDTSAQKVFLAGSNRQYGLFVPNAPGSGGAAIPGIRTIFIRRPDVAQNRVGSRLLSAILAHERTHILVEKKLGMFRANATPTWKKEGYPEYIAGEPIQISGEMRSRIKASGLQPILPVQHGYVAYHLRVKYLMDLEKVSFDDLFARDFDLSQLDRRVAANIDSLSTN
jgi:hypothetical protein